MTADIFGRILRDECGVMRGAHVLAAVSGGADSVAMLCLLHRAREQMGICVSCAHVEHGIRGEESLEDMAFVRELCRRKNIALYDTRVDAPAYARKMGCGVEAAARALRYAFFEETRTAIGADVIAVAHHSGDQAETVLMHAARGSDLRGLCAMRMRSGRIIRPLLGATSLELRAYLNSINQAWREDATNADTHYTRNCIRHRVLLELERAYGGAQGALSRLALAAQRDEDFFSRQIAVLGIHLIPLADGTAVEIDAIKDLHDALLSRVLVRLMDAVGADASGHVIDALTGALRRRDYSFAMSVESFSGEIVQARMGERYLCVSRLKMEIPDTPLSMEGETHTPFGVFSVRPALEDETGDGLFSQVVPESALKGARVTCRQEGDVLIPFGKHAPVKVKKLLIDSGVERAMRRSVPIIRNDQEILWLVGLRPAESCRAAQGETRRMIVFRPAECVKIQYGDSIFREEEIRG